MRPYGPRSERTARLLNQLELTLEELESAAIEDELAAEIASAKTKNTTMTVASFTRQRPSRQPFPDHLPRERVIVPGPVACKRGNRPAAEDSESETPRISASSVSMDEKNLVVPVFKYPVFLRIVWLTF